ncbi:MAG: uracil-DNA glycosylase [Ideonella sp.]|nr:uracil-DNA glycosylase [Ideonella sp.]
MWTERQRAMLDAMGITLWLPTAAGGAAPVAPATGEIVPQRGPRPLPERASGRSSPRSSEQESTQPPACPADRDRGTARAATTMPCSVTAGDHAPRPTIDVSQLDWPALRERVAACRACRLCEGRTQTVFGVGHERAHCMIVGEAPGEHEDRQGEPFVGAAGQLLDRMLRAIGLTRAQAQPAQQVYIANTLKCRPPRNRNPEPHELALCGSYLQRQIELVQPRLLLAMGRFAVQALLRSDEPIGRLRARVHRWRDTPVVVTYHPAYLLRNPADKARAWADLCLAAQQLQQTTR